MNMLEWARREVELACEKENPNRKEGEWDYGCACYESALKAYECLINDGHSGYSFSVTKQILNRLLDEIPLTSLEDRDEDWIKDESPSPSDEEYESYQHVRRGSLWKRVYPDGKVELRDYDRARFVNEDAPNALWCNGLATKIVHELYPIKFPYMPQNRPYILYGSEYLTDPKNGDFDTIEFGGIKTPEGDVVPVNRYFKESDEGWTEIDHAEFLERRNMHYRRINEHDRV